MAKRIPKIELYWTTTPTAAGGHVPVINWRMVAANGETLCQCTQGFTSREDTKRNLTTTAGIFCGDIDKVRIVGPGRKPS